MKDMARDAPEEMPENRDPAAIPGWDPQEGGVARNGREEPPRNGGEEPLRNGSPDPAGTKDRDLAGPRGADPGEAEEAVLADLRAAGLASHLAAGPASGAEAATLRALSGLAAGSIYRLEAFRYAFRLQAGDVGGALADLAPEQWGGALERALQAAGAAALEVHALAAPVPEAQEAPSEAAAEAPPVWLLRAWDTAVEAGIRTAGPGVQAVINAHFAADTARLTAALTADAAAAPAGVAPTGAQINVAPTGAQDNVAPTSAQDNATPTGAQDNATPVGAQENAAPAAEAQGDLGGAALERRLEALEARLTGLEAATLPAEAAGEARAALAGLVRRLDAGNADFRRGLGRALAEFLVQIEAGDGACDGARDGARDGAGGFVFIDPPRAG